MSLIDIAKLPTAENSAIHLNVKDNVAIARVPLAAGAELRIDGRSIVTTMPVPAGHKVCIRSIGQGEYIIRYGQVIGRANRPIEVGSHIHTHNLAFEEITFNYEFPETELALPSLSANIPTFMGYQREDGRVGTRNYIAVVAASNCAAHAAEMIAASFTGELLPNVDGVAAFPHGEGCGHSIGPDTEQLQRTLGGVMNHPNVGAAIILGLGCEVNQIDHYLGKNSPRTNRMIGMTLQGEGGTSAIVANARKAIRDLMEQISAEHRVQVPATKIQLGLNCGGSDSFSGITANPALGYTSDLLAEIGASSVLAETTEIFGAEHLLVKRARSRAVAEKLLAMVKGYKIYLNRFEGSSFNDNPSPGNKEGGLTNILEKSLGAATKGGTSQLNQVLEYAERITAPGFCFMNTPGYDPVSLTGLAAGGSNLIAFTTGRGSAIGFPTIPVIKIATNTPMYKRMKDNMDVNAGRIADGEADVQGVGKEIFELLLAVASGERTCAERLGHKEFVPWRIGPVM